LTGEVLARRYAGALADLAFEEKAHDAVRTQLNAFAGIAVESGIVAALLDPSLGLDEKIALVDEVAGTLKFEKILANFVKLLVEKKRIGDIVAINEVFQMILDEKVGRVRAEVVLPSAAGKDEIEEIKKGLEKATGKEVVLDVSIDPALLGGVVARVGSIVYDGSIRTQLENIKNNIMRG
jgi:F-type H+-transporting ATPase subunit delta